MRLWEQFLYNLSSFINIFFLSEALILIDLLYQIIFESADQILKRNRVRRGLISCSSRRINLVILRFVRIIQILSLIFIFAEIGEQDENLWTIEPAIRIR